MSKNKKQLVKVEFCGKREKEYKGRLLGLINQNEFFKIMNSKRLQSKLFSYKSTTVEDVAERDSVEGMRLVLAIKEVDKENKPGKNLLISEPLDFVSYIEDNQIGVLGEQGEYLLITEID